MKKLPLIYIMFFPYLFVLATCLIFKSFVKESGFIIFATTSVIMSALFMLTAILAIIFIVFKWNEKDALLFNLLVKIVYIPVHLILFVVMLGMGNPFLFMLMFIPLIISLMFMGITGTIALAGIISGYRIGIFKLSTSIIYGILSYCFIIYVIVAIIAYIKARLIS